MYIVAEIPPTEYILVEDKNMRLCIVISINRVRTLRTRLLISDALLSKSYSGAIRYGKVCRKTMFLNAINMFLFVCLD